MAKNLVDLLIKHEGKVPYAYKDHLGYWTIGVGRLIDKDKGGRLSDDEIAYLLNNDIKNKSIECMAHIDFFKELDVVRQDALVNLCFNIGINGLLKFKNTLKALSEKRWDDAEKGLRDSRWATQVQKERVDDICHMIKTGEYR